MSAPRRAGSVTWPRRATLDIHPPVALVAASCASVGMAAADALAADGWFVHLCTGTAEPAVMPPETRQTRSWGRHHTADLRLAVDLDRMTDAVGPVDAVVVGGDAEWFDISSHQVERVFVDEVHRGVGAQRVVMNTAMGMICRSTGSVVALASTDDVVELTTFTRALATRLGRNGVRVNAVCWKDPDRSAQQVAAVIGFLLSDAARSVTGAVLPVDYHRLRADVQP